MKTHIIKYRIKEAPRTWKKGTWINRDRKSYRHIEIHTWNNWEHSYWIGFYKNDDIAFVCDSETIKALAKDIIRLERKKKILSKLSLHSTNLAI